VVDGLPAHKAKSVRRFLDQVKDHIRLFFLPPYSPEINPDELVWNDVKNNGVGRTLIRDVRDLNREVNSRLAAAAEKIPTRFAPSSRWKPLATQLPRSRQHMNWSVTGDAGLRLVIPGRCEASNPESRDSGSGADAPSRNDGA